jgi:hypothetical protein
MARDAALGAHRTSSRLIGGAGFSAFRASILSFFLMAREAFGVIRPNVFY